MRSMIPALIIVGLCTLIGSDYSSAPRSRLVAGDAARPDDSNIWLSEDGPGPIVLAPLGEKAGGDERNEAFIYTTGEPNMWSTEGEDVKVRFDTPNARGRWRGRPRGYLAGCRSIQLPESSPASRNTTRLAAIRCN